MDNVFVTPARDADGKPMVVPDPHTFKPLGADGEWKPLSPYWVRRIRDQDVVAGEPPKEIAAPVAETESPVAEAEPQAPAETRSRR